MSVSMTAARSPSRSEPANGRIVTQADAAVAEEAREDVEALEHLVHRFGQFTVARELGSFPLERLRT
jgi:hypothetical protein